MSPIRTTHGACGILSALILCLPHSTSAQSAADPCKQLTQAEVTAATGSQVGEGHGIGGTCSWSGTPKVIVSLWYPGPAIWPGLAHPSAMVSQTQVPSLGDNAFVNVMGGFASLGVRKGTSVFVIKVYGFNDPAKQIAIEKTLAAAVLAKM